MNKRWRIPEAYIVDPKTRQWVSDANEPLAWAQSVEIMAILAMKRSLAERNAVKPAGQGAKPVEPAHKPVEPSDKIKAPN